MAQHHRVALGRNRRADRPRLPKHVLLRHLQLAGPEEDRPASRRHRHGGARSLRRHSGQPAHAAEPDLAPAGVRQSRRHGRSRSAPLVRAGDADHVHPALRRDRELHRRQSVCVPRSRRVRHRRPIHRPGLRRLEQAGQQAALPQHPGRRALHPREPPGPHRRGDPLVQDDRAPGLPALGRPDPGVAARRHVAALRAAVRLLALRRAALRLRQGQLRIEAPALLQLLHQHPGPLPAGRGRLPQLSLRGRPLQPDSERDLWPLAGDGSPAGPEDPQRREGDVPQGGPPRRGPDAAHLRRRPGRSDHEAGRGQQGRRQCTGTGPDPGSAHRADPGHQGNDGRGARPDQGRVPRHPLPDPRGNADDDGDRGDRTGQREGHPDRADGRPPAVRVPQPLHPS